MKQFARYFRNVPLMGKFVLPTDLVSHAYRRMFYKFYLSGLTSPQFKAKELSFYGMIQWVYVIDGFHENLAIMVFKKLLTQKSHFSYTCHAIRVLWSLKIYMFIHTTVLNRTNILTVHFSTYKIDQTRQ